MTTCSGCGQCCVVLALAVSRFEVATNAVMPAPRERRFILEELTPITAKEAKERAPWLFASAEGRMGWHPILGMLPASFYYTCVHYDAETGLCDDHANRPGICRSFPEECPGWPHEGFDLPPACAYNADIGKPVGPVPVRMGRR